MAKCERCGKGPESGNNVSHSQVRTKRKFRPNVQKVLVTVDGKAKSMKLCTRCLRTVYKTS